MLKPVHKQDSHMLKGENKREKAVPYERFIRVCGGVNGNLVNIDLKEDT